LPATPERTAIRNFERRRKRGEKKKGVSFSLGEREKTKEKGISSRERKKKKRGCSVPLKIPGFGQCFGAQKKVLVRGKGERRGPALLPRGRGE